MQQVYFNSHAYLLPGKAEQAEAARLAAELKAAEEQRLAEAEKAAPRPAILTGFVNF